MKKILSHGMLSVVTAVVLAAALSGCYSVGMTAAGEVQARSSYFVVSGTSYKPGNNPTQIYNSLTSIKGSNCSEWRPDYSPTLGGVGVVDKKLFECDPQTATAKKAVSSTLSEYRAQKIAAAEK